MSRGNRGAGGDHAAATGRFTHGRTDETPPASRAVDSLSFCS